MFSFKKSRAINTANGNASAVSKPCGRVLGTIRTMCLFTQSRQHDLITQQLPVPEGQHRAPRFRLYLPALTASSKAERGEGETCSKRVTRQVTTVVYDLDHLSVCLYICAYLSVCLSYLFVCLSVRIIHTYVCVCGRKFHCVCVFNELGEGGGRWGPPMLHVEV